MAKAKAYILKTFIKSFLTLFLPFFIIILISYIIKLSTITAKLNLELSDFLMMLLYIMPKIFFVTLPLTFIGAIINTFAKLSNENEVLTLFALGYNPKNIFLYFFFVTLFYSIILLLIALFIVPLSEQKMENFKKQKIYEAKLKIVPKKLHQSFGNAHIFIDENKNGTFKKVTLFQKENSNIFQILFAKSGSLKKNKRAYLNLNEGTLYKYHQDKFQIVYYKNMKIYNDKRFYQKKILSPIDYWKKKKGGLLFNILISLSPFIFLPALIALGIYNPRYQRDFSSFYILFIVLLIYLPALIVNKNENLLIFFIILSTWIILSFTIFYSKLLKRY